MRLALAQQLRPKTHSPSLQGGLRIFNILAVTLFIAITTTRQLLPKTVMQTLRSFEKGEHLILMCEPLRSTRLGNASVQSHLVNRDDIKVCLCSDTSHLSQEPSYQP